VVLALFGMFSTCSVSRPHHHRRVRQQIDYRQLPNGASFVEYTQFRSNSTLFCIIMLQVPEDPRPPRTNCQQELCGQQRTHARSLQHNLGLLNNQIINSKNIQQKSWNLMTLRVPRVIGQTVKQRQKYSSRTGAQNSITIHLLG